MEVKAKLRHLRISPKKVRLVCDVIRGLDVQAAQAQLSTLSKGATRPVLKLLNSAVANATNNFKLDKDNLFVKSVTVDMGPTIHRSQPRAFGRAFPIRKRTSHVAITLEEKVPGVPSEKESETKVVDSLPKDVKLTKEEKKK